jgi:hypothetical protein
MKYFLMTLAISFSAMALPEINLNTKCYQIKDSIDRQYCENKKYSLLKSTYTNQAKKWKKGLSKKDKQKQANNLRVKLAEKNEMLKFIKEEIRLIETNQTSLFNTKTKKKKINRELEKNLEEGLNIKL